VERCFSLPFKVIVDREKCISCGLAPSICPKVFVLGEDNGKNRVIEEYSVETTETLSIGKVPDELYECVKEAAEACPVSAITVEKT